MLHFLDDVRHNSPHLKIIFLRDFDGWERGVVRHQEEAAVLQVDALEGELAVDEADGNLVVGGLQRFVYDHDVAILDADTFHAVARDAGVKRGCLVADNVTVEVQNGFRVILGRGGESCMDTLHHGNLVVVRMWGENVNVGHKGYYYFGVYYV